MEQRNLILDMVPSERKRLAHKFMGMLGDPDVTTVLALIRRDYGMRMIGTSDSGKREKLYHEAQALDRLVGEMQSFASEVMLTKEDEDGEDS